MEEEGEYATRSSNKDFKKGEKNGGFEREK